ncbi:MAG: GNAT family N-acetyltransferase, partial [Chitinophagaceae bacterium]|nr:GNAT family N-acetyltransferase [Anaerolineae bacterium]
MSPIHVRRAKLDDTQAISALFRSRVSVWQRLKSDGRVEDLPYEALTIYERWLHGGAAYSNAWMSVETGAIFLSHLLRGFGLPLVATLDGTVHGYAEAYPGSEPAPFGKHLHLSHLVTISENEDLSAALIEALTTYARDLSIERVTVAVSNYDTQAAAFYKRYGMQPLSRVRRYTLPAQTGQSFYKVTEHRSADPAQIEGWQMSIGRIESARQHWATLWPRLWEAV